MSPRSCDIDAPVTTERDIEFMRMALEAAEEGLGLASPNPLVGSVVVRDGVVVGRGMHLYANKKHGEVVALDDAGELARGATVYVNLEPCSHFGRTPPCVHSLVAAGVRRVVAAMQDPAPYVNGRGFAMLREAGIEVEIGLEEAAARRLNEHYVTYVTTGRPFVHLKLATTLDGRIAAGSGAAKWITGPQSRDASQLLRLSADAILVGVRTVLVDDPSLTYRGARAKRLPLIRCVLDPKLRTPASSRLAQSTREAPVVVYTLENGDPAAWRAARALREAGVEIVALPGTERDGLDLGAVLADLGARQVQGLVVEGGSETAGAFVDARLVDKVTFFIAPKVLGGRDSIGAVGGRPRLTLSEALELRNVTSRRHGDDVEITGYPR